MNNPIILFLLIGTLLLTSCGGSSGDNSLDSSATAISTNTLMSDIPDVVMADLNSATSDNLASSATHLYAFEQLLNGTQNAEVDWPLRLAEQIKFRPLGDLVSRVDNEGEVVLGYSDSTTISVLETNTENQLFVKQNVDGNTTYMVAKDDRITGIYFEDINIQLSYASNDSFNGIFLDSSDTESVYVEIENPEDTLALSDTISQVLAPDARSIDNTKSDPLLFQRNDSNDNSCAVSYDRYCDHVPGIHFVCSTNMFASRKIQPRGILTDIAQITGNMVLSSTDAMCVTALSAQILCHVADTICEATNGEEQTPVQIDRPRLTDKRNTACRSRNCAQSWGDPHIITWDGLAYDFQSVGEFVLTTSNDGRFDVQVRQTPFGRSRTASINSGIAVNVMGDSVSVVREFADDRTATLYINNNQIDFSSGFETTLPQGGMVEFSEGTFRLTWPLVDGPEVYISLGSAIDLTLVSDESMSYTGLLGTLDGISENDVQLPSGIELSFPLDIARLYGEFADSWRVSEDNSLFTYIEGQSTESFTDRDFPRFIDRIENYPEAAQALARAACESVGDQGLSVLEACMYDVLVTNEIGFIESYTTERAVEQQASLAGGIFFTGSDPTEIIRTAWQQHDGLEVTQSNPLGVIELTCEPERHGAICEYDDSTIPDAVDFGWGPAPDALIIGLSKRSNLCETPGSCRAYADFSYFQTFLNIPSTTVLENLVVQFSGMDDGSRVSICNSRFPNCEIVEGSYVFLGGSGTTDLSPVAVAGEINRVVITQVDDCCSSNNLRSAQVLLNEQVVTLVDSVQ